MLELRHLRTFVVVAEERHFTRASARLHVAQPAVSQQIRTLERQVGQALFERNARGVKLTRAGEVLLPHARATLRAAEIGFAEVAAITNALQGTLRIGVVEAVDALGIPALLTQFHREHPGVRLEVRQAGSEDLVDLVREGVMDVGFVSAGDDTCPPGVIIRWLRPVDRVVVGVPAGHPLARREQVSLAEIATEPVVTLVEGTGHRTMINHAYADIGTLPPVVCDTSSVVDVVNLVSAGMGICLLPESVAASAARTVTAIRLVEPVLRRSLGMAWRSPEATSSLARAFLSFAESNPPDETGPGSTS